MFRATSSVASFNGSLASRSNRLPGSSSVIASWSICSTIVDIQTGEEVLLWPAVLPRSGEGRSLVPPRKQ